MFSKDDFIKMKIELLLKNQFFVKILLQERMKIELLLKNQFFVKILLQERLNPKKNILHLHAHKNG